MTETIKKEQLLQHIVNEQIAFQFADELMNFTNVQSSDRDDLNDIRRIKECVINSHSIKLTSINSLSYNDSFHELTSWSNEADSLFLVNNELLINIGNNAI